jgi:hypothetical protein
MDPLPYELYGESEGALALCWDVHSSIAQYSLLPRPKNVTSL